MASGCARNLTQGDLAAMVGCTRQSVNKLLGQFTDDGLIRLEREGIVVTDVDGLTRRPAAEARSPRAPSSSDRQAA